MVCYGVCSRDLHLVSGTLAVAQDSIQACQWQCCSQDTSSAEWLCPRGCSSSGGDFHRCVHHTSLWRHAPDLWTSMSSWDLSLHITARHLEKRFPRSSCMSVMLLIIFFQSVICLPCTQKCLPFVELIHSLNNTRRQVFVVKYIATLITSEYYMKHKKRKEKNKLTEEAFMAR